MSIRHQGSSQVFESTLQHFAGAFHPEPGAHKNEAFFAPFDLQNTLSTHQPTFATAMLVLDSHTFPVPSVFRLR
ncbi:MAG: hypothetical protein RR100_02080, partial [Comamonas sp.]